MSLFGARKGCQIRSRLRGEWRKLAVVLAEAAARVRPADVAIFHEFSPPPGGGGHQFLRALWHELEQRGLRVENNRISVTTRACLFNSFNFDLERLRRFRRAGCRMVHRVDGPIGAYRGRDDGTDRRIWEINQELADATVFQSHYSLDRHQELGLQFRSPHVVLNAADPSIFHNHGRIPFDRQRRVRLVSSSWSDNPNKGAATYKWIEDHLDWDRFEFTFVGRSPVHFDRIRVLGPVPSARLSTVLRQHDVYISASRNESCSNSLIEALSCGLPALYLQSGGNPEIVGEGGLGFVHEQEIPELLDRLVDDYEARQQRISVPSLAEVTGRYLEAMGVVLVEVA